MDINKATSISISLPAGSVRNMEKRNGFYFLPAENITFLCFLGMVTKSEMTCLFEDEKQRPDLQTSPSWRTQGISVDYVN